MENKHYRICPECNFFCNVQETDKYCSLCGAELIETCPECNKAIANPYAKYCKHCGTPYPGRQPKADPGIRF